MWIRILSVCVSAGFISFGSSTTAAIYIALSIAFSRSVRSFVRSFVIVPLSILHCVLASSPLSIQHTLHTSSRITIEHIAFGFFFAELHENFLWMYKVDKLTSLQNTHTLKKIFSFSTNTQNAHCSFEFFRTSIYSSACVLCKSYTQTELDTQHTLAHVLTVYIPMKCNQWSVRHSKSIFKIS